MFGATRWGGLRSKIIAWSFVPTAIILVAVAGVTFIAYQQVTEELVIQRDKDLARLSADRLATELAEYGDLLTALGRTASIYRGVPVAQNAALKRAGSRLAVFDAGVVICDMHGTIVATEPERPEILGQDWSEHSFFQELIEASTPSAPASVFSSILATGPQGMEVVGVAVPITAEQGEFVGAMVGMFRLGATAVSAFYGDIVKLRFGESGSTYLIDANGRVVYHSDASHIGEDFSTQEIVQQALTRQVDAVRTRDTRGVDIVASFAPVPGTPWSLVVEEKWVTLTSATRGYRQFLLLLLALGVVVPALVVAIGVRRITRPIRELIRAAKEVAAGNFDHTILERSGDEIEELAEQFNQMSAQLRESYAHLEQRVADRTRELAALNAIAAAVSQTLDLDAVLHEALDKTLQVMGTAAGGIYLLNDKAGVLSIAAQRGFNPQFVAEIDKLKVGEGFSGRVAQAGQPLVVKDVSADSRLTRMAVREERLRSLAIVPLSSKGKVLGTLFTSTYGDREFSDQDIQLLTSIGNQIGVAIDNARFFEAEQRRAEQFRVISEVGQRITSILEIDELLVQVVRLIRQAFGYYHVGIALIEGDEAVYKVGSGELWEDPLFQFLPARLKVGQEGITGWVAASGEALLVPDVTQETRYIWMRGSKTRSELAIPLKAKGEVIAVLDLQSDRLHAFDESDVVVLQSLADQVAVAIENARHHGQAQQVAVLEERNRLARDLHDAVTQTLFSASLIAEALPAIWASDYQEGAQLLKELRQLNRGALAEMRTLLLELRPSALMETGLGDLLRQLAEAVAGRTGLAVTVTAEGPCRPPADVHVALYRMAQEALNNVAKHAHAKQVTVSLHGSIDPSGLDGERRERIELQVSDDGRGFDPSKVPSDRLGLGILRERARAIGASLSIESEAGLGTRIALVWEQGSDEPQKAGSR